MKEQSIYIFGNGNLAFVNFMEQYCSKIVEQCILPQVNFMVCEFRGADMLAMELLKNHSASVTILHVGKTPRYFPDKFRTYCSEWKLVGGFLNDEERDNYAIENCTAFIARDYNSDKNKITATAKNIARLLGMGKIQL
jgi:hypothetical protein